MSNKQGKWEFLRPFVNASKVISPEITNQEIADKAIERFSLNLDREAARKVVSKIVNGELEEEGGPSVTEANFLEEVISTKEVSLVEKANTFTHNKPGQYLVLGCAHVPFHNEALVKAITHMMSEVEFEGLILNGDFLDCNSLSGHDRGKFTAIPGLDLRKEYEGGREVLGDLLRWLKPEALKAYMYGNHEDRYQRYIGDMQNAKTPPPSPTEGLKLLQQGFKVIESYASGYMTLGKHLDIIHGIYYNSHCSKTHIDRFRGSVLFAHTHRVQSYVEGQTGGFNIGWLGNKDHKAFSYADRGVKASWQNGFAVVTIDDNGDYYVNQVFCNNNKFYYNSKCYN